MFKEIRESVDLMEGISKYTNLEWVSVGSYNFELENKECPFPDCGHKDCFRVKKDDDEYFYKCFSCDEFGSDITKFYATLKGMDLYGAARAVAKDFNIEIKRSFTPAQKILELSAAYFHANLFECTEEFEYEKRKLTPLAYQVEVRGHSPELLAQEMVGYVGKNLYQFLATFDFTDKELVDSGMFRRDKKTGAVQPMFFHPNVFIYPHFLNGQVSHFTTKDPLKVLPPYQLKNEHRLNDILFYGQDKFKKAQRIIVVEGENDRLTMMAHSQKTDAVLCCNGQLSKQQVDWLVEHIEERDLVTIFDNDDAGAKYRDKMWKTPIKSLTQLAAPEPYKDVDEFLRNNIAHTVNDLVEVPNPYKLPEDETDALEGCEVFVMKGCYYKMRATAEGGQVPVRLSNFIIKLKNIFVKDNTRNREVILLRNDGIKATCPFLTSATKVSLKAFREFVADGIDGNFYGSESDLTAMWDFVYSKSPDRVVHIPREMGDLDNGRGWLFNDAFIQSNGVCVSPDDEGIMWINGNSIGYKPVSNQDGASEQDDNPWHSLRIRGASELSPEERQDLLTGYIQNLGRNLGSLPAALTMVAWMNANAYSKTVFDAYGFFPFLFLWGRHAKGKTTLIKWLMATYGMQDIGYASLPNLGTGVGFSRNLAVYSSLPMCLDEVRADQQTKNFYGHFRAWYNRQGRTLGVKGNQTKVHTQEVRATLILGGQDVLTDAATRSRCIEVQIPTNGREMQESYVWMEQRIDDLRWLGLEWILEASNSNKQDVLEGMRSHEKEIVAAVHCDSRVAKHWSMISYFGQRLAARCGIQIDFLKHVVDACAQSVADQEEEDVLMRFFSTLEGMQIEEHTPITKDHIMVEGEYLILWMTELVRLVKQRGGSLLNEGERFSKNAIMKMLQDEPYYVECGRRYMGGSKIQRRAYVLKGELPPPLQNIKAVASAW